MNQLFYTKIPGNLKKQDFCEINGIAYYVKLIEDGKHFTTLMFSDDRQGFIQVSIGLQGAHDLPLEKSVSEASE